MADVASPTWVGRTTAPSWPHCAAAASLAAPTPDHFIPLLYLAGLSDADWQRPDVLVDGYAFGSLSMIAYTFGPSCDVDATEFGAPPEPPAAPIESSNI